MSEGKILIEAKSVHREAKEGSLSLLSILKI